MLASRIPALNGAAITSKTCMYTMTPDENFVIDAHPDFSNVHIAAGFSGHGFKFGPLMGEALAIASLGQCDTASLTAWVAGESDLDLADMA